MAQQSPTDSTSTYDAFMSYSHAADGLLAPRLQSALQHFAKPWWKRRAIRVFRDEASLSANPHLWTSIAQALDESRWFVLMLSPEAAASEWVRREIEHWKAHHDPSRMLLVLTDGEFGWDGSNVTGNVVSETLHRVFDEEPRWVDLRFAKGDEELDLKNPRFSSAVADLASAIRGVHKDELESEEVRQHRRTVRTAWAAGIVMAILFVAAVASAIQASRSAQLATAGELSAFAVDQVDADPELATLLALEAIDAAPGSDPPPGVLNALWRAGEANRLIDVFDTGSGGFTTIDVAPDGEHLAISEETTARVRWYDTQTFHVEWTHVGETSDNYQGIRVSPDGEVIAVGVMNWGAPLTVQRFDVDDDLPNRIVILRSEDGAVERTIEIEDCVSVAEAIWSPDGRYLAYNAGFGGCPRGDPPTQHWIEVLDTDSWERHAFIADPDPNVAPGLLSFDDAGRLYNIGFNGVEVFEAGTFDNVKSLPTSGIGRVAPRGGRMVLHTFDPLPAALPFVVDIESGVRSDILAPMPGRVAAPFGLDFSRQGEYVLAGSEFGSAEVFDLGSGERVFSLPVGEAASVQIDWDRRRAYTSNVDGTVRTWDLGQRAVGLTQLERFLSGKRILANSFAVGPQLGAFVGATDEGDAGEYAIEFFDVSTGVLVGETREGVEIEALADGRFLIQNASNVWHIYDPRTETSEPLIGCDSPGISCDASRLDRESCKDCEEAPGRLLDVVVAGDTDEVFVHVFGGSEGGSLHRIDLDGELVEAVPGGNSFDNIYAISETSIIGEDGGTMLRDRANGDELWSEWQAGPVELAPDHRHAVASDSAGGISLVALSTGEVTRFDLGIGLIRGLAFDPDGNRVAVGGVDSLAIVDLDERAVAQLIGIPDVSDIHWIDEEHLVVAANTGWSRVSLDVDDAIDQVRSQVYRSFTSSECKQYRIDPCRTLQELMAG